MILPHVMHLLLSLSFLQNQDASFFVIYYFSNMSMMLFIPDKGFKYNFSYRLRHQAWLYNSILWASICRNCWLVWLEIVRLYGNEQAIRSRVLDKLRDKIDFMLKSSKCTNKSMGKATPSMMEARRNLRNSVFTSFSVT